MELFNKRNKSEPKLTRTEKYMQNKGLDGIAPDSHKQVEAIMTDLSGNGLIKAGMAFSFAKAEEQAKVSYLSALVEQNWILIKQNDDLIKEMRKLNDK